MSRSTWRSPSPYAGRPRTLQRVGLAALVAEQAYFVVAMRTHITAVSGWRSPALFQAIARSPIAIAVTLGVIWASCVALAMGRRSLSAGVAALVASHVLVEAMLGPIGTFPPGTFLVGLLLLGWVAGLALARWTAPRGLNAAQRRFRAEAMAEQLAMTGFAAGYVSAGLAKWVRSGLSWDHRVIWHATTALQSVSEPSGIQQLAAMTSNNAALATAVAYAAMAIQIGAIAIPWSATARLWAGGALGLLHAGMWAFGGLREYVTLLVVACYVIPWHRLRAPLVRQRTAAGVAADERRAVLVALPSAKLSRLLLGATLVVAAFAGVGWGVHLDARYAPRASHALHIWEPFTLITARAEGHHQPGPADRALIAPLTVGAEMDGWRLWQVRGVAGGAVELFWQPSRSSAGVAAARRRYVMRISRPDPFSGKRHIRWRALAGTTADGGAALRTLTAHVAALVARHPAEAQVRWPDAAVQKLGWRAERQPWLPAWEVSPSESKGRSPAAAESPVLRPR